MASSAAAVGWQIDIPSLSQLIVNFGAYGLKQLALAGVDVHSIGCLLLISNSTPARMEYRQELNKQRSLQRSERQWFFTVVEVGGASNFLVDELLKTRAGENVLALMSSLIPHLGESEFPRVLMKTFEQFGLPAESTPGIGQLAKIRSALVTFAGRMDFKDRVLLTHNVFLSLEERLKRVPRVSIPPEEILPKVIHMLHRTAISDQHVLHISGLPGAAWIATYAMHILGLGTCVVKGDGKWFPMTTSYDDSKVIFFPDSGPSIALWKEKKIQDLISWDANIQEQPATKWLVNCDRVNFFHFHCNEKKRNIGVRIAESLSHFVAAKTFGAINNLLKDIVAPRGTGTQSKHFMLCFLPQIQDRALKIIRRLGFSPESAEFYQGYYSMTQWRKAFDAQRPSVISYRHAEQYFGAMRWNSHRPPTDISSIEDPTVPNELRRPERNLESLFAKIALRLSIVEDQRTDSKLEDIPQGLLHILNTAIKLASSLAFTDWNHNHRSLSSEFFWRRPITGKDIVIPTTLTPFEALEQKIMIRALQYGTKVCHDHLEMKSSEIYWSRNLLGKDCDGIVVIRHLACSQDLFKLPGCLATFHPGSITVDGEKFHEFGDDLLGGLQKPDPNVTRLPRSIHDSFISIEDLFPELRVQTVITIMADYLLLKSHLLVSNTTEILPISPSRIASNTMQLLVTHPCEHEDVSRSLTIGSTTASTDILFEWSAGLVLNQFGMPAENTTNSVHGGLASMSTMPVIQVHIQQVDNNHLGQWVSVHAQDRGAKLPCVQILQQDACLDCIVSRLSPDAFGGRGYQVFIIPNTGSAGR